MNEADYEQAVARFYEALYAFGYSLAGNEDDACELTQETFCRLLTKGGQVAKARFCLLNGSLIQRRNNMNNEEAKLILQAYRPGGQDANDPRFREALEQAQRDPELARWFANEQALDYRISARLNKSIKPPAHLKSQLLAQQRIIRPVAWWKKPAWQLAAAACLALLVTIAAVWLKPARSTGFVQYRNEMAEFAGHKLDRLDLMSSDMAEVRRWLAQKESHGDLALPAGLDGRPSLGCRLLDWKGHKVSLLCFELENRQVAHLLVVDSDVFKDAPPESPAFNQIGEVATVSWSHGGKTYVVASKGGNQLDLMKLL